MSSEIEDVVELADRLDFAEVERLPHSDDISNTVPDIAISPPQTAARVSPKTRRTILSVRPMPPMLRMPWKSLPPMAASWRRNRTSCAAWPTI